MGFWSFLREMLVFDWLFEGKPHPDPPRKGGGQSWDDGHYASDDYYHDSADDYAHDFDDFEDDF